MARYENEGIDSAIIGKALYEGRFDLATALDAVTKVEPLPEETPIDLLESRE